MIPEFSPTNRKSDRYESRIAIEPGVPQPSLRWNSAGPDATRGNLTVAAGPDPELIFACGWREWQL
jgi:hypothetical protein